jgi:imidazolonepropionase-like amidohydrolase
MGADGQMGQADHTQGAWAQGARAQAGHARSGQAEMGPLRIGQVQPGFRADLIVVDQNPLDDLVALGSVRMVVQDGCIVKPLV